jgi:hypothetical protein
MKNKEQLYSLAFESDSDISDKDILIFSALFQSCLSTIMNEINWKYHIHGYIDKESVKDEPKKYKMGFTIKKQSLWTRIKSVCIMRFSMRKLYRKVARRYKDAS